jgi:hypothetical protein
MHTEPLTSGDIGERADAAAVLAQLVKRFEEFRANHARLTRVPTDLRSAVLDAVDSGVSAHAIRRACGVSSSQITSWLDGRTRSRATPPHRDDVRVFPVVEQSPNATPQAEQTLTLQLGAWSVSVRVASAPPTTRS